MSPIINNSIYILFIFLFFFFSLHCRLKEARHDICALSSHSGKTHLSAHILAKSEFLRNG